MKALVSHLVVLGRLLGKFPLEIWIILDLRNGIDLHTISHLAWAPTWRNPNLHRLMTSAENQELGTAMILQERNKKRWVTAFA